jgi:hypothetical protein
MASEMTLGPLRVKYLVNGESGLSADVVGVEESDDNLTQTSKHVRRIYLPLPSGKMVYLLLHWSDETDLSQLDEMVASGADYGDMFDGAVPGGLMTIRCNNCSSRYRAIVADAGNPLFDDIAARLRLHTFVDSCPRCKHKLQPHVLEILRVDQRP